MKISGVANQIKAMMLLWPPLMGGLQTVLSNCACSPGALSSAMRKGLKHASEVDAELKALPAKRMRVFLDTVANEVCHDKASAIRCDVLKTAKLEEEIYHPPQ